MFWDALSLDEQEAVAAIGTRRTYPEGSLVFFDGDPATFVVIVLSGKLKLTRSAVDGRSILIEFRGAGDIVGELGAIDREPRSATVEVSSAVEALVVPADRFRELLSDRGGVALAVLSTVTERLRESSRRRLESGTSDAVTRLAGRLVELAEQQSPTAVDDLVLDSALTQQELAEWIGVSRDAVVLALRQLRELGWIETGRQRIRIRDLEALRRFSR